jgi:hypothetical protein
VMPAQMPYATYAIPAACSPFATMNTACRHPSLARP